MEAGTQSLGDAGFEAPPARRSMAARPPLVLTALGILVALAAVLPALYLLIVDAGAIGDALSAAFSSRVAGILVRTLALVAAVVATAIVIAVPLGWLTVRTDLPGRRLWATLCTLPLVIPSYVGAYLFVAALGPQGLLADAIGAGSLPSVYGFTGAWIVLSLFTYPLILIPVRGTLKRLDPQLEEAARGMGRSPREVFRTIVLPQLWPPIAAGALLVALYVLSDFGAVSILRFDSFTSEIYVAYSSAFDRVETAALGTVLVVLMVIGLWVASRLRNRHALHRLGPGSARPATPVALGRWRWPALGLCSAVVAIALVMPVGVLVYWATQGIDDGSTTLGAVAGFAGNSILTGFWAALIATVAALVVAVLAGRFPNPLTRFIERCGYAGYALPGVVVALAMVYTATRAAPFVYQTVALLIFALTIHYLPLAIGSIGSSLAQVSPRVEEAARGLGRGPLTVLRTVTVPLVRGGILAGSALVFLHALKELPATLILAPTGFDTLATDIWRQTQFGFYEASAIPALILLAIAAPPLYLLSERGTVAS
ncbi:iron ABC transporter permease [Thermoleophilia bacterium SCSIO 60948]|nr:iron ABC transporter permease [Thermoleophilia bacterium SCSIO 60948]